jgi:hypothetical protein
MGVDGEVVQEAASFCRRPPSTADPSFTHHRRRIAATSTVGFPNTPPAMSALPRSIGSKVLAPALRPSAARALAPRYRAYATKETTPEDAPAVKVNSESTQIREESAAEGMRNKPDYNVAIDYRTSCVSPRWFAGKAS